MNQQDIKQLEDLTALRQVYRDQTYRVNLVEKIGTARLIVLHPKKSLIRRILRR